MTVGNDLRLVARHYYAQRRRQRIEAMWDNIIALIAWGFLLGFLFHQWRALP